MKLIRRILGRPSQSDFAEMMIAELRRIGIEGAVEYVASDFRLDLNECKGYRFWLHNAYAEYMAAPRAERRGLLRSFALVTLTPSIPGTFDEVKPLLLPKIRQRSFYELTPLYSALAEPARPGEPPRASPHQVFSEYLACGLVVDYPDTVVELGPESLAGWGMDFAAALEVATDNLWKKSNGIFTKITDGLWCSPWSDTHDASRLTLTNLIGGLRIRGDMVAMVPHRNVLLVTGSDDAEGLLAMAAVGKQAYEGPRRISGIPIVHDGTTWVSFLPTQDHPANGPLKHLTYMTLANDYNEQKAMWDAWNERIGEPVCIANYTVFGHRETGALRSVATWVEGVDTLLPQTEFVGFLGHGDGGEPRFIGEVPWVRLETLLETALRKTNMAPARFRTERFPTEAELKALLE